MRGTQKLCPKLRAEWNMAGSYNNYQTCVQWYTILWTTKPDVQWYYIMLKYNTFKDSTGQYYSAE